MQRQTTHYGYDGIQSQCYKYYSRHGEISRAEQETGLRQTNDSLLRSRGLMKKTKQENPARKEWQSGKTKLGCSFLQTN